MNKSCQQLTLEATAVYPGQHHYFGLPDAIPDAFNWPGVRKTQWCVLITPLIVTQISRYSIVLLVFKRTILSATYVRNCDCDGNFIWSF